MMRLILATLLSTTALLAQHEADLQNGQRLFRANCVVCHGPEGTMMGLDLLHAKFRRPLSDADLSSTIRGGIKNTPMGPSNLNESQTADIVAYMRSSAAAPVVQVVLGDAARGKAIFEGKGECLTCHRVRGNGSRYSPDLSDIGLTRRPDQIQRSLLDPDAEVTPQNRVYRVTPKTGVPITGRVLNQDTFTVQIIDANQQLLSFEKANLRELTVVDQSPMPSVRGRLSDAEVADLTAYLVSLKGSN